MDQIPANIFLSVGGTDNPSHRAFVTAIRDFLNAEGLSPRTVGQGKDIYWTQPLKNIRNVMAQCSGTVIIAFERTHIETGTERQDPLHDVRLPTVWNHIEAAMAYTYEHPLLVIVQKGLKKEGLLEGTYDWYVQYIDLDLTAMQSAEFIGVFNDWKKSVLERHRRLSAPRVVVLLHGIRTEGYWHNHFEQTIEQISQGSKPVKILSRKYGNFPLLEYAIPILRSRKVIWLRQTIEAQQRQYPESEIWLVAHSFGSYLVAEVLKRNPGVRIHGIIFCGAVVKRDYDWDKLFLNKQVKCVLNDCGTRDLWPVMSRLLIPGTGDAGVCGFYAGGDLVKNRFFEYYNHSSCFNPTHIKEYWWPFLSAGRVTPEPDLTEPYWLIRLLISLRWPIRLLFLSFIAWLAYSVGNNLKVLWK